jgi:hypothetical protein
VAGFCAALWLDFTPALTVPANDILSDYMQAMRDADQPIARQWDQ